MLILVFVLVFGAVAAPTGVILLINRSQQRVQFEITCATLETGLIEARGIQANRILLVRIADSLGLPVDIPPRIALPEVPEECAEF